MVLEHKVTLLEYTLLRNLVIVLLSMGLLAVKGIDPFTTLPSDRRAIMLGRVICGVSVSLLINASLELIPFSLLIILYQTNPFWTSVLSFFFNNEPILPVELIGMILCFVAVVVIATNDYSDHDMLDAQVGVLNELTTVEEQEVQL